MHTNQVVTWLADKPVKPEFIFRVAALISTYIRSEGYGPNSAYDYWLAKRPDFFALDATPLVDAEIGTDAGGR
jgi:hypothetical protein